MHSAFLVLHDSQLWFLPTWIKLCLGICICINFQILIGLCHLLFKVVTFLILFLNRQTQPHNSRRILSLSINFFCVKEFLLLSSERYIVWKVHISSDYKWNGSLFWRGVGITWISVPLKPYSKGFFLAWKNLKTNTKGQNS